MEASNLLVQELWDEVLDHLCNSRKDLLSSALVCRAFVGRAQMHLFRSIIIASLRHQTTLSAAQLAEIISRSPHLIDYISELYVGRCDVETLTPLVHILWSRVSAISLAHSDEGQVPALDLIGTLVSLPTLRKISFHSNAWEADHLRAVLAGCNPCVISLAFHTCSPELLPPNTENTLAPPPYGSPRLNITHLELFFADTIPEFLGDAACPIDLSRVAHIKFGWSTGVGLYPLLYGFGDSIESLDVDAGDPGLESLDFGSLSALSHLTVRGHGLSLQRAMELSRESNLRSICYRMATWRGTTGLIGLQNIQSSILSAKMPKLQRVEVMVVVDEYNKYTTAQWTSRIEDNLSHLVKRGILTIQFHRLSL
ncbi:hypothetical protein MVEN_01873800 [Mycena venus]|uniref:Uncharacterized protein n=1 Tax=Mycena venus TaxID=2733690 RepID=A0A8H6XH25_9AGAR|nr:hypothetical protein MVEN_01873800 [Mycena venus]